MLVVEAASGVEAALCSRNGVVGLGPWSELEIPTSSVKACQGALVELLAALKQTQMFASTTMPVASRPQ